MMNISNQSPPIGSKRKLMRHGLCATGLGLAGLLTTIGLLLNGLSLQPAGIAAVICLTTGLVLLGFGIMVIAADPFADEEIG